MQDNVVVEIAIERNRPPMRQPKINCHSKTAGQRELFSLGALVEEHLAGPQQHGVDVAGEVEDLQRPRLGHRLCGVNYDADDLTACRTVILSYLDN